MVCGFLAKEVARATDGIIGIRDLADRGRGHRRLGLGSSMMAEQTKTQTAAFLPARAGVIAGVRVVAAVGVVAARAAVAAFGRIAAAIGAAAAGAVAVAAAATALEVRTAGQGNQDQDGQ